MHRRPTFPRFPSRKPLRLAGHDYRCPGAYFITTVTHGRALCLGAVHEGRVVLSPVGEAVRAAWEAIPRKFPNAQVDCVVVMPNHVHGIIVLLERAATTASLGTIVGWFKAAACRTAGFPPGTLWQERFHDRVLRDIDDWEDARGYIAENPMRWGNDRENPHRRPEP